MPTKEIPSLQFAEHLAARLEQWRREAKELSERYSQPALASLTLTHVDEIEHDLATLADEPLSLKDAAAVSGYSADHLGRLVKAGTLENVGTVARPKVRRGDLPTKCRKEDLRESETRLSLGSTRMQIARAVVTAK